MSSIELKPCPFCGGKGCMNQEKDRICSYVKCINCGAESGLVKVSAEYCSDERAAEKWNSRYEDALQKKYDDFSSECDLTDTLRHNSPKATNFDTAIVRAVQALRSYGIDYHDILPDTAHIMISDSKGNSRDVDEFIAEMEGKN